jgi:hypothetical protein
VVIQTLDGVLSIWNLVTNLHANYQAARRSQAGGSDPQRSLGLRGSS